MLQEAPGVALNAGSLLSGSANLGEKFSIGHLARNSGALCSAATYVTVDAGGKRAFFKIKIDTFLEIDTEFTIVYFLDVTSQVEIASMQREIGRQNEKN